MVRSVWTHAKMVESEKNLMDDDNQMTDEANSGKKREVDFEIEEVKAEIKEVKAEINNVEAALGGRRDDAGDYGDYALMDFETREAKLRPRLSELSNQLTELQKEKNILVADKSNHKRLQNKIRLVEEERKSKLARYTTEEVKVLIDCCTRHFGSKNGSAAQLLQETDNKVCYLCGTTEDVQTSHVIQIQDTKDVGSPTFDSLLECLKEWKNTTHWRRAFFMNGPMNMIFLCRQHNIAFERHAFCLIVSKPLEHDETVKFHSLDSTFDALVKEANRRLLSPDYPKFNLSYLSKRAIAYRLFKVAAAGNLLPTDSNVLTHEAIAALSISRSVRPANDEDCAS